MCAANNTPQQVTTIIHKQKVLLRVSSNNTPTAVEYELTRSRTSIGRSANCDIPINEDLVSDLHFQIEERNGLYYLVHPHPSRVARGAGTANGFYYQGTQYGGNDRFDQLLTHGAVFRIGEPGGTMVIIVFDDGSGDVPHIPLKDIDLRSNTLTLGRAPDNDVRLDHETVSSHHARLERHGAGYRLIDLHSTNYVYVNSVRQTNYALLRGDEIKIGPFKLTYADRLLRFNENRTIRIEAKNLCKVVLNEGKEKVLLNDISLVIPPRQFVALVGGSGAGKSTLLRALNGQGPASGSVDYNGQDYYKSYAAFSTQLGYVPQDDIVHRELTVQDALDYAARLRLPDDYTEAQIQSRIKEVLAEVELDGKKDTFINKLSGGQRKRVSIALELLANPSIFFLDEPTSGLDPGLDRKMMNLLRKLADKNGQTVVLVTHATHNINICDYVCFMGAGRLVYFGPPAQAMTFFNKTDFADIYNLLDTEPACEYWCEKFKKDSNYQTYISDPLQAASKKLPQGKQVIPEPAMRSHLLHQLALLSARYFKLLKNDHGNLRILLLQTPVLACIIYILIKTTIGSGGFDTNKVVQCPRTAQVFTLTGLPDLPRPSYPAVSKDCGQLKTLLQTTPQGRVYAAQRGGVDEALQDFIVPGPGNAPMILFLMAFATFMCGSINSSREIVKEDPIYRRERAVNVAIFPYLFSKIAVLGALCLVQSAVLVSVICLADPFPHGTFLPGWLEVYITLALTSLAGLALGLTISAVVPNSDRAMSTLPLLLVPQVIFSGILFPLAGGWMQIIGMLFPMRWSMAALGSTVGLHSDKLFGPAQDGDKLFGNSYSYHSTLFSTYSLTNAIQHLLYIWLALAAIIIVLVIITSIFLKVKDRRSFGYLRHKCIKCTQPLAYPNSPICHACNARQFA